MITIAETDAERAEAFDVIVQLRPHLTRETFVAQARRQTEAVGWKLAVLRSDGRVVACAGFRIAEWLAWGKALYVDDLVTDASVRSGGHGGALLDWLVQYGKREGCDSLQLDSGVQRFDAHRFYLAKRMEIRSHHFSLKL